MPCRQPVHLNTPNAQFFFLLSPFYAYLSAYELVQKLDLQILYIYFSLIFHVYYNLHHILHINYLYCLHIYHYYCRRLIRLLRSYLYARACACMYIQQPWKSLQFTGYLSSLYITWSKEKTIKSVKSYVCMFSSFLIVIKKRKWEKDWISM
jgi:hypothetical protein